MKIDHVALYCVDLEAMRNFFVQHLNAVCNHEYHNPRTGLRAYFLQFQDGGCQLEIMSRPEVTEARNGLFDSGFIHICISVGSREQVDALTGSIHAAGFEIQSGPRITGDGYYESCILGPEGVLVELTV